MNRRSVIIKLVGAIALVIASGHNWPLLIIFGAFPPPVALPNQDRGKLLTAPIAVAVSKSGQCELIKFGNACDGRL